MGLQVSRRGLLRSAAGSVAAGAALGGVAAPPAAADAQPAAAAPPAVVPGQAGPLADAEYASGFDGLRVLPDDGRYQTLSQGFNQRFTSEPRYIQLITDDDSAVAAVREALKHDLRPTIRGGGHCYEDFVENTGGAILDVSTMKGIHRTEDKYGRPAYCVESGSTNWDMYCQLFRRYGVTAPGGSCYSVGVGGHICGGGYGVLSRRNGLIVDHLVQVDVVTVRGGEVEVTCAHRSDPPMSDTGQLFWAHTGGGGGNFGMVLRYYFTGALPTPPARVWLSSIAWPWAEILKKPGDFARLLKNFGEFFARHSGPDESVYQDLFSILKLTHKTNGNLALGSHWMRDETGPLDEYLAAIQEGLSTEPIVLTDLAASAGAQFQPQMSALSPVSAVSVVEKRRQMPWFQETMTVNGSGPNQRGKYKSAYHRKPFTDQQIAALWHWLTKDVEGVDLTQTLCQVDSYGCRTNAVAPTETAVPQRDSIMKLQYQTYWTMPAQDEAHLKFMRAFYEDVYRKTGGVPEISDARHDRTTDGCYVNYPDIDLGVATERAPKYPRLYYKQNYARLQQTKRLWDPRNVFHHAQSIIP
ncbi:FAD-binding protein [Actinospica durhamensis]|uniref:FAD-binding protein n=1 Tax=Actinospica durhamensis TaxID=1508375 RepID=A0A941EX19_9ACTN|nr:FAD-binding protein [Actinospica durhamensis]MBR7838883.1 FAD-binding protein [Actinospica durhamensis]